MLLTSAAVGGVLLLGESVNFLHPGTGRSPGIVDLPVQRDSLGYPIIYASSVKGALKSLCVRINCRDKVDTKTGKVKCSECPLCCCLFGGEPGEGEKGIGALAFLDIIPLAIPVHSAEQSYVYLTTPVLLARASMLLEALGENKLRDALDTLYRESLGLQEDKVLVLSDSLAQLQSITIASIAFDTKKSENAGKVYSVLKESVADKLGGLASSLPDLLVVASPQASSLLVKRGVVTATRVALRRDRKTVSHHALWTEEYLPYGMVLLTGILELSYGNEFCEACGCKPGERLDKLLEALKASNNTFYAVIGGKESIGRGMIKFVVEKSHAG